MRVEMKRIESRKTFVMTLEADKMWIETKEKKAEEEKTRRLNSNYRKEKRSKKMMLQE